MKKGNDSTIKEALNNYLKAYHLDERLHEASLKNNWEKIVGKTIAKYTTSVSLSKKVVTIHVSVAPLKSELSYNSEKVKTLINEFLKQPVVDKVQVF